MEYRELGKTGLQVSAVGFGSVEIGMDYGIGTGGQYGKPDKKTAIKIINKALDCGINLFDTAPAYGDSEKLLGAVIGSKPCYIATKVSVPPENQDAGKFIRASVENSLRNLRKDCLDIVQIHNAAADTAGQSDIPEILSDLRKEGLIRFIGASVYEPENATAVIKANCFNVLQIAYNILDQRMSKEVIPQARKQGIGILGRSAYFKGVLTARAEYLGQRCEFLRNAANNIKTAMQLHSWDELAELALGFCLSNKGIDAVLVGIQKTEELDFAVKVEKQERLSQGLFEQLLKLGIEDKYWLNPSNWPVDVK